MKIVKTSSRAEALADGTMAIVMTLLVIELHPPDNPEEFRALLPHIGWYFLSFFLLGTHWIAHHNAFQWIKGMNHVLLWLNILFLSFVSLTPFTTSFVGEHPHSQLAVVLYATNILAVFLSLFAIWEYATWRDLLDSTWVVEKTRKVIRRMLVPISVAALALILSTSI